MFVAQAEAGLEVPLGMARCGRVGTDGQPEGFIGVTFGAKHLRCSALRARRKDGERGQHALAVRLRTDHTSAVEHR